MSKQSRDPPTPPRLTLVSSCGWLPVFGTDDWQADLALLVDVGVVDFRFEGDPGGLEGVLGREDELHSKRSLVVRRGILGCGGWEISLLHIEVEERGSCTSIHTLLDTLAGKREFIWAPTEYLPERYSLAR